MSVVGRRLLNAALQKQTFYKRFYPAGTYNWTVPKGCTEVDVFLVGGGGGGYSTGGGGGGYTATYLKQVVGEGESIPITVGIGVVGKLWSTRAGASSFKELSALGGYSAYNAMRAGYGGSGGGRGVYNGGTDGGDGYPSTTGGIGQGTTTRDFGETSGGRNAGGGGGGSTTTSGGAGGASDYTEGSGIKVAGSVYSNGGGGYGGGGGGTSVDSSQGGDGTVLLRYTAYTSAARVYVFKSSVPTIAVSSTAQTVYGSIESYIADKFGNEISKIGYTLQSKPTWATVSGNAITVTANTSSSSRTGVVVWVQAESGYLLEISLNQEGTAPTYYTVTFNALFDEYNWLSSTSPVSGASDAIVSGGSFTFYAYVAGAALMGQYSLDGGATWLDMLQGAQANTWVRLIYITSDTNILVKANVK